MERSEGRPRVGREREAVAVPGPRVVQGVGGGRASAGRQGCGDQIRTPAKGKQGKERRLLIPGGESQGGCPRPQRTMGT